MQGTNPSRELTNKKTDKPSREPTLTRERNQGNQPLQGNGTKGTNPSHKGTKESSSNAISRKASKQGLC